MTDVSGLFKWNETPYNGRMRIVVSAGRDVCATIYKEAVDHSGDDDDDDQMMMKESLQERINIMTRWQKGKKTLINRNVLSFVTILIGILDN